VNKIITALKSLKKYYLYIILWTLLISILIYLLFPSGIAIEFYLSLIIIYLAGLFYFFGKERKNELDEIQSIISSIRLNKIKSKDSIKLNRSLKILEGEIYAMYVKMQDDINYLKKLEKMRTQFLANVSHELRTPIFKVQGYIETLLDGAINDEKVNLNFLNKAKNSTIYLGNLLNDLIDISMIESGEMKMSFRYFNLNEYILSIVNHFKDTTVKRKIDIVYNPCRSDLKIYGDKERLNVVFSNLIQNAIKYTDVGQIALIVEEFDNGVNITIKDTGIGISSIDLNRIFERFYRTKLARSRSVSGTGLGLAIVKHIVEAHNSKIIVNSRAGEGSEFSFTLRK